MIVVGEVFFFFLRSSDPDRDCDFFKGMISKVVTVSVRGVSSLIAYYKITIHTMESRIFFYI